MASKKRFKKSKRGIILIVEGASDRTALEGYLECAFPNCVIETYVHGGDLTTGMDKDDKKIPKYNPKNEVSGIVLKMMMKNGWQVTDVERVIHITDTDGAYVSDSYIVEDQTIDGKMQCTDSALLCKNPINTKTRNHYKRRYTLELLKQSALQDFGWNIKYELYYMSTNLEHVTQGHSKPYSQQEKNDLAQELRNQCYADASYASRLFSDVSIAGKTLDESWDYIMKDRRSLERHTNLGLLGF